MSYVIVCAGSTGHRHPERRLAAVELVELVPGDRASLQVFSRTFTGRQELSAPVPVILGHALDVECPKCSGRGRLSADRAASSELVELAELLGGTVPIEACR